MAFIHSRNQTMYAISVAIRTYHYPVISWILAHQEREYCPAKMHKQDAEKIKELIGKPL